MSQQRITVLGATGSIGASTLDVIARHPDRYAVFALTAHRQVERMQALCLAHQPRYAVMADEAAAEQLSSALRMRGCSTEVLGGVEALAKVAAHPEVDQVMAAIVGAAGLPATLAAAEAGKRVLLANKEALVMSGALFMRAVQESGATLLPIDSEHNAIFQCLPTHAFSERALGSSLQLPHAGIERIWLTGSGGPFRTRAVETLPAVTPAEAIAHPNWDMGAKISVDSATMMNKGLEFIEARWLFDVPASAIEVVVHPQSIVHSMVAYRDGSVLAQLGQPDMRTPIAHALAWPERMDAGVQALDLFQMQALEFSRPDFARYPCLRLAQEADAAGGVAPVVLNAANEMAVAAFLAGTLGYAAIAQRIEAALEQIQDGNVDSLEGVLAVDAATRNWFAEAA
ncbi:MAG: 1-deoxy-D-xylulose-5-phosphate reductoisomerase [Gammaproteobacteria bacterium]